MLSSIIKNTLARTSFGSNLLFQRYHYMFTPLQLKALIEIAENTKDITGCYVEVGCAYGATTVLMSKTFQDLGIERRIYALDTFKGFVDSHAQHDIDLLGKDSSLKNDFKNNDESWMQASLRAGNVKNYVVHKCDATEFDYKICSPIAIALLDVDLYQPIYSILPKLYENLSPGGLIVVDDCAPSTKWEGALIAYQKFTSEMGIKQQIVNGKLGLIQR